MIIRAVHLWMLLLSFTTSAEGGGASSKSDKKKASQDPHDNRGNTPFFLQDASDEMCLGSSGFTICDETALWILTKRVGRKTYSLVSLLNPPEQGGICLERKTSFLGLLSSDRVSLGSCNKEGSKSWMFEFIDKTHVKLSNKGQCLVRGKKELKNSVSLQSCQIGEFASLVYHPTAVHENGFYVKAADGACFDGSKFRSCEGVGASKLLWGVGVRYSGGQAHRYLFNFNIHDRNSCIVAHHSRVEKGFCSDRGAVSWSLEHGGRLSTANSQLCLARRNDDTALMMKCKYGHEFVHVEVPSIYTNEQLNQMAKKPNLSADEEATLREAIRRKASLANTAA